MVSSNELNENYAGPHYKEWRTCPMGPRRRAVRAARDAAVVAWGEGLRGDVLVRFAVDQAVKTIEGSPLLLYIGLQVLVAILKFMIEKWLESKLRDQPHGGS